jgi:hypothetical protein
MASIYPIRGLFGKLTLMRRRVHRAYTVQRLMVRSGVRVERKSMNRPRKIDDLSKHRPQRQMAEVLPNPPNPPSPWRGLLATEIVLDIGGGTFANIATNLTTLADYDITNCVALIHDWQRSGYDNAMPMHYPTNASYGGDAGMRDLVATGARLGIRCALHENYVDYCPNHDFFQHERHRARCRGAASVGVVQPRHAHQCPPNETPTRGGKRTSLNQTLTSLL